MIKVYVGTTLKKAPKMVDENRTLKDVLTENNVDYTKGITTLDGAPLGAGALNKTFLEYGYDGTEGHNMATLMNVVKADNA